MKNQPPVIVEEYATMEEEYLAEHGTLDGYEEMLARLAQQMRVTAAERAAAAKKRRRPKKPEPVAEEVIEYETMEEEYLAEHGTLDGYEEMMANLEQKMRELAAIGYRFVTKGDEVLYLQRPADKKRRRKS